MSLLLDALNRASKEKQKAAAASQSEAIATAPAQAPQSVAQPVPEAASPSLTSVPAQALKWEEIPHPTPTPAPAHRAPDETLRPEPPVLMTPVAPGPELELTLVDAPPATDTPTPNTRFEPPPGPELPPQLEIPPLESAPAGLVREPTLEPTAEPAMQAVPAAPPEVSPAAAVVPPPAPTPAASTPREPTLVAPVTLPPVPVVPQPPESVPVPVPPATPAPEAAPTLGLAAAASAKTVPDGQMAQDIRRAYEGTSSDARKGRRRVMALGGLAVGLALAFGSVFLGLWGDPAKWTGGGSLSTVAPAAPATAVDPAGPGAVPAGEVPAAMATASASVATTTPAAVALSAQAPVAPLVKPISEAKTASSNQAAPATPNQAQTSKDVAPKSAAVTAPAAAAPATNAAAPAVSSKASPVSTGNEVVLSANTRVNPSFVAKTRGPSALEQGYALLLQGRLDDAAAAYGQALRANPAERDALMGMAYISQQKGQREDAQTYYRRVLRQEPNNARALAALQALDSGSDPTLTASRTGDLAARQPDSAAAMAMAGNAFVRDGLLSNAAQAYARAQTLEPTNPLHAYNHAVALDRLGQFAPAIVQYERVLTLSATAPVAERAYRIDDVRLRLAQLRQALATTEPAAP